MNSPRVETPPYRDGFDRALDYILTTIWSSLFVLIFLSALNVIPLHPRLPIHLLLLVATFLFVVSGIAYILLRQFNVYSKMRIEQEFGSFPPP